MRIQRFALTVTGAVVCGVMIVMAQQGGVAPYTAAQATAGRGLYQTNCASCHGPDLKGVGQIPGIAGRSTNYVVRQLYDVKHGFRTGVFAWTRSVVRFSIAI